MSARRPPLAGPRAAPQCGVPCVAAAPTQALQHGPWWSRGVPTALPCCTALLLLPIAAALLNAILALQIVFYGGGGAAKNAGRRGKKKRT